MSDKEKVVSGKSFARLVAVQGLYSHELSGEDNIDDAIARISEIPLDVDEDGVVAKPSKQFLEVIFQGTYEQKSEIDEIIKKYLKEGWEMERLDNLLLSIIRPAVYELKSEDTPVSVVLDEYINIAHAFYDTQEVGFINAILDSVAKELRDNVSN